MAPMQPMAAMQRLPAVASPIRTGSAYLLAVIVTAILTTVGLASIAIVSRARQTSALRESVGIAQASIESGLDLASHRMTLAPDWRTLYSTAPIVNAVTIGSGTVTVTGTAVDATITSDVELVAEAVAAEAVQIVTATLRPKGVAMSGLGSALHVTGDITFEGANVYADAPITSNADVLAITSEINAPIQAVGTIAGTTYLGTTQQSADPRTSPDPSMIDTLAADAVWIPFDSLPSGRIENILLSPTNQPYTAVTHPDGLYAIDCGGANITVSTCRIVGTLILLDVGSSSIIENSVLLQPARPDYPSLLVDGSITIRIDRMMLTESDAGVNLNPTGTPYEGFTDAMIDDRYPSEIRGVVFVSETLTTRKRAVFRGAVFANALDCRGSLSIRHDSSLQRNPPAGFVDHYTYALVPGTWKKSVR